LAGALKVAFTETGLNPIDLNDFELKTTNTLFATAAGNLLKYCNWNE
jgi:hypothetical protein